ncbi:MAG: ATP-binding cassette domain-containing protein [Streptosporangiales bacterium]|nr:ATP-binding cassette domain-containing protein [Streptosporangiales bacterium]
MAEAPASWPSSTADDGHAAEVTLRLDDAYFAYDVAPVLERVHGIAHAGDSVALIGPNGAGKSTLLKGILGLVPLVRGSITVLGTTPAKARRRIGYVPQADTLDAEFPVSAAQVVLMGRYRAIGWLRRPGKADRQLALDALDRVGLRDRAGDQFGALSGGQRQRVLLARAIVSEPRMMLLDEPTGGLDAVSQEALLEALRELKQAGVTIVVSTHDLSLAHLACDEVCLLNKHQFAYGPVESTLTPDNLRATYGGHALELPGEHVIIAQNR